MVIVPVRAPEAVGVNVTMIVQVAPDGKVAAQLLVWAKSPLLAIFEMFKLALPALVTVKCCGTLVVPVDWPTYTRLFPERFRDGPLAVPQLPLGGAVPVPPPNSYPPISIVLTVVRPSAQAGCTY
jgi:hypothetical protein